MQIDTMLTDEDYAANAQAADTYQQALYGSGKATEALDYLMEERGLTPRTIGHFGLGYVPEADDTSGFADSVPPAHEKLRGHIAIPYINERGVTAIRFRAMPGADGPKYRDLPGAGTWLYNIRAITAASAGSVIHICEGEIDTATAHQMGLYVVGMSGAQKWKPHHRHLLEGFSHVRVLCDDDKAGHEMGEKIKDSIPGAFVELLPAPNGLDVNSAYLEGGAEHLLNYWGITPDWNTEENA